MSWAAVIVGAGTVIGGVVANKGSKDAANTAARGADAASAEAARQFDLIRGDTADARAIGQQANRALGSIYGYQPASSYFGNSPVPAGATPFSASMPQATLGGASFDPGGKLAMKFGGAAQLLAPHTFLFGSKHGDEQRNLKAFMADNQLYDLGNGMVSMADGRTFSKDQLQQVAGAYYGARYHPDGNQADWQQRYDASLTAAPQANVGQAGGGMTSDGVPQGFGPVQGPAQGPAGQSMDPNSPNYGAFFQSPDYQFRKQQGMQGIGNSFSASGGAKSGNALKALADFNSNLAAGEFGNYFNRQAALAGIGQTATGQSGSAGIATGQIIGNAQQNAANTRASGVAGQYNAIGGALSGLGQGLGYYMQQRQQQDPYPQLNYFTPTARRM